MQDKPHHAPKHADLDWKEFVTKPWTMPREGHDLLVTDKNSAICAEQFKYHEVRQCVYHSVPTEYFHNHHFAEQIPMYEMRRDGSGEPFSNILELRATKIREFLTYDQFPFVEKLITAQYEKLVSEGTASLLAEIEKIVGVKARCDPSPPQNRTVRPVDPEYLKYMNAHVDWEAERLIGYDVATQ